MALGRGLFFDYDRESPALGKLTVAIGDLVEDETAVPADLGVIVSEAVEGITGPYLQLVVIDRVKDVNVVSVHGTTAAEITEDLFKGRIKIVGLIQIKPGAVSDCRCGQPDDAGHLFMGWERNIYSV
jgi:hypothetical protein